MKALHIRVVPWRYGKLRKIPRLALCAPELVLFPRFLTTGIQETLYSELEQYHDSFRMLYSIRAAS
jgi:hypothetical protein